MNSFLLIVAALASAVMLISPGGRLFLVTGAGLFVFTAGFADLPTRVMFVTLVLLSSAVSILRLRNSVVRPSKWLVLSGACYGTALLIAALVGWAEDPQRTLQAGMPYVLLLILLPIALDAGLATSFRKIEIGLIVVGVVATASFSVDWLSRRRISTLDLDQLLAGSFLMSALVFQWGLITSIWGSEKWLMRIVAIVVSVFVPIAYLITGTRSSLVFFVGFLAVMIGRPIRAKMLRTAIFVTASIAVAIALLDLLAASLLTRPDFVSERLASLRGVLSYGGAADASWQMRQLSTEAATRVLDGHWAFGRGLSTPNPLLHFDTPLSSVMRIGVVGVLFLVLYMFVALRWAMNTAPRSAQGDSARGIIVGWSLIVVTYGGFLIAPVNDPLFAFAFAIAIALAVSARDDRLGTPLEPPASSSPKQMSQSSSRHISGQHKEIMSTGPQRPRSRQPGSLRSEP